MGKFTTSKSAVARKTGVKKATPTWLSDSQIEHMKCIYSIVSMLNKYGNEPWHTDHIIPLRGKNVCGLNVPWNLRPLTAKENCSKQNKIEIKG